MEDRKVAKAVISTSEGLEFMDVREGRLEKLLGREMSLRSAKEYLATAKVGEYSEEMLTCFPRTFDNLKKFARTADKAEYCQVHMKELMKIIKVSQECCKDAKALYSKASEHRFIDIDTVKAQCESEQRFVMHFVKSNIFTPCPGGEYKLQFDCTERAAKAVFAVRGLETKPQ